MAKERYVEVYSQGVTNVRKIIVDAETRHKSDGAAVFVKKGCTVGMECLYLKG